MGSWLLLLLFIYLFNILFFIILRRIINKEVELSGY